MSEKVFIDFGEVGKRIATRRKLVDISQKDLAERVGLEPNTISKIESSGAGLSIESLMSISKILGVVPNYVLCGTEVTTDIVGKVAEKLNVLNNSRDLELLSGFIDVMSNTD